jgi:hypothetical protein
MTEVERLAPPNAVRCLIGMKADLDTRQVSTDAGKAFAAENRMPLFFEVCANKDLPESGAEEAILALINTIMSIPEEEEEKKNVEQDTQCKCSLS